MANSTFEQHITSIPTVDSPIPLYLQLADILRDRIRKEEWLVGSLIPTLEVLAQDFRVARVTVRQAVQLLTKEGLLTPRRGFGTVVTQANKAPNVVVMKTSLRSLAAMYESTSAKMLTYDEARGTPRVDPALGDLAANYVYMRRIHFTEGEPYALIALYLEQSIFQRAPDAFRSHAVIPELLKMKAVRIRRAHQTMSIGSADAEAARLLRVRAGTPVAHVTRVFVDPRNRILYHAEVIYRGDWVKWEIELQP